MQYSSDSGRRQRLKGEGSERLKVDDGEADCCDALRGNGTENKKI